MSGFNNVNTRIKHYWHNIILTYIPTDNPNTRRMVYYCVRLICVVCTYHNIIIHLDVYFIQIIVFEHLLLYYYTFTHFKTNSSRSTYRTQLSFYYWLWGNVISFSKSWTRKYLSTCTLNNIITVYISLSLQYTSHLLLLCCIFSSVSFVNIKHGTYTSFAMTLIAYFISYILLYVLEYTLQQSEKNTSIA